MISGCHVMIFSADADADRAFLRDMLDLPGLGEALIVHVRAMTIAPS